MSKDRGRNPLAVDFVQKFLQVVRKSRAGVSYTLYTTYFSGKQPQGKNRKARRGDVAWERGAQWRALKASFGFYQRTMAKNKQVRIERHAENNRLKSATRRKTYA